MAVTRYRFGFFMSHTAGNITYHQNLRRVISTEQDIDAHWTEVSYYREGGAIEKLRERIFPFLPTYLTGVLRAALDMRSGVNKASYDALFINDSIAIFFGQVLRRIPSIVDMDSTPIQIDRMPAYGSPKDAAPIAYLKWRLWREMVNHARLVQVWSNWARKSVIEDYDVPAAQVYVNPPGIDLEQWRPVARSGKPGANRLLRVLFVGGDFKRKGGPQMIEWFRQRSGVPCELHIVTREPIERGEGIFVYQNMQPNTPELMRLYHESDLFVLPSLAECFGIATVEAMGTGLPVIASDVGGTADIIEPGRNGYIVPSGKVEMLGAAIEQVLNDADLRFSMGQQSRLLATQRFDVRINTQRTINHLKQLVDASVEHEEEVSSAVSI